MIEIMDCYQKYVPQKTDCTPLILLLHADGLSCERGNDAQSARINGSNAWTQLQGLKMSIQEWHKRQLLLQDAYDELYSGQSARDKGTLFHLKNFFNHRSVSSNVKDDFDHNEEFLDFCAQGYILLAAVHIMNIGDLDEKPIDMPNNENERQLYLDRVSDEIADSCFLSVVHISNKAVDVSNDTEDTYDYCICKQEKLGQTMIYCDNKHCKKGTWFHLECLNMSEEDVPNGKWYCSPECEMPIRKQGKGKRKVVVDALTDHKRDYALMVMWRGLNQRIRKDAIRENDGERMIRHWKFDMLQFFEKSHPKYFLQGQRLLSACNGAVSPRLKHTIIWNRTVNTRGGKGNNVAMDLHMEHLNNEYKASVKDSGMLTPDTIARHSQMVGIGKAIRNVYELKLADGHTRTHRKAVVDRSKDLKTFVEMMVSERIFENNPGRHHNAFQDFKFEILQNVNPKKLNARLVRLRKELSKRVKIIKQMQDR